MPLDSVPIVAAWHQAANTRNDWPEALRLARRLAATLPTHPLAIRQLALAEHNLRNPVPSGRSGQRYLLRNSLEWAAAEQAAVALLDSSAALATTPADRARALFWRGRVLEFEGALLDALAAYEAALRADPSDSASGRAAAQVVANLRASSTPAR